MKGIGKFRFRGEPLSRIKQARVAVTSRRIKVQLLVDAPQPEATDLRLMLGCKVGIKAQITLSNGIQSPKRKRDLRQVQWGQRRLARAVNDSNGRCKKKRLLAKSWQRVREQEYGYLPELTAEVDHSPQIHHVARAQVLYF